LLLLVLSSHTPDKWLLFAIVAIAGAMVGAYLSYDLAAKGGEALLHRYVPEKYTERVTRWVKENPVLSIGLPALLPPPIPLTPFVIAAGALRMPKKKFLVTFAIFRSARYLAEAWLAQYYGKHLIRLWKRYFGESMAPVIWTFVVLITLGGGLVSTLLTYTYVFTINPLDHAIYSGGHRTGPPSSSATIGSVLCVPSCTTNLRGPPDVDRSHSDTPA
jgi:membrane protein YqaA with SNARE-associated domain